MTDHDFLTEAESIQADDPPRRWSHRCARCGNPRHFWPYYARGWLVWHLIVRPWPLSWGVPPLLPIAGDYAFDHRGCEHECGSETFADDPTPLPGSLFKVVVTLGMGGVVVAVVIGGMLRG